MKILSNKIFSGNNSIFYTKDIDYESNTSFYTKYKKLLIKGRNNNLFIRSINFILDFIFLMREKFYFSPYFNNIKIRHLFNIKWNYKISMFSIGSINQDNSIKDSNGNIINNNSNLTININIFKENTENQSNTILNKEDNVKRKEKIIFNIIIEIKIK